MQHSIAITAIGVVGEKLRCVRSFLRLMHQTGTAPVARVNYTTSTHGVNTARAYCNHTGTLTIVSQPPLLFGFLN